jgi:hypothetical protein
VGRRRATGAAASAAQPAATGFAARTSPVGGARLPWSYLAALLAALVTGLGFAIADAAQSASCPADDAVCALGVYTVGGLIAAIVATVLVTWAFRLGWEWGLVCAAVVLAMPSLLDATGPLAWLILVIAPGLAAAVTWSGPERPRWRPVAIGVVCGAAIVASLLWTFVPPGA